MELLIKIWSVFGFSVYWIVGIGSMLFGASCWMGIIYGILAYVVWFIIHQALCLANGDGWIWNW
jgi:hypothetical protein